MPRFILLHVESPMQGWGDVARDGRRPSSEVPGRSAITGLLANALGWRYEEAIRTNVLQASLRLAVSCSAERLPAVMEDFQTAYLHGDARGWTRRGVEGRKSDFAEGTTILRKEYAVDAAYAVAIGLREDAPVTHDALERALMHPARTLFLGRRSCLPVRPVYDGSVESMNAVAALRLRVRGGARVWYDEGEGDATDPRLEEQGVRDFVTDRFTGGQRMVCAIMPGALTP